MKTYPSQRHFAVPVALAISAHVLLLFGFRSPKPVHTGSPDILVPTPPLPPVISVDLSPPPDSETDPIGKSKLAGDLVPSVPDHPEVAQHGDITMPVIPSEVQKIVTGIYTLPTRPPGDGTIGTRGAQIFSSTDLDATPRVLSQISPAYPMSLRSVGISGRVTVTFLVDQGGRVSDIKVQSASHSDFIEPTLRAVAHWRFEPGKRNGRPVSFRMSVPLDFVLNP